MSDIARWLENLGLGEYATVFEESKIDLHILPEIDGEDLRELEIPLGPRKLILKAIAGLKAGLGSEADPKDVAEEAVPAIGRSASEAERRQLTVMFVDMVGSTAMSRQLDPEEMREAITTFQDAVAGAVTRFDGQVAKYMGDGVLCYFGWPIAHEDDAERAVRSGLAIMHTIDGITAPNGEVILARCGVATGLVVVGDLVGQGAAQEEAVVGDTPNLAARLQGVAAPGQVVVSETTRGLLGDLFEFGDLGPQNLRGVATDVSAFAVKGERLSETRFAARQKDRISALIGRDQELALLIERWRLASSGEGQMLLLTGEAGIGKSRISRGLIDALSDEDYTRIGYQCSPYHADSALYPAIQQLTFAACFNANDTAEVKLDKLETLLSVAGTDISESATLIAGLLGLGEIAEARFGSIDLSPQQRRAHTLEALFNQFAELASVKPVLFVLEDAHWVDPTTLELVEMCLDRIGDIRVLLLVTARPTFEYGFGGHPIVTRLTLNRLGREQVSKIVTHVAKGKSLPSELLNEIVDKTDGVPLFVEEFTKTLLESDTLRETESAWVLDGPLNINAIPTSLHDSLMARLDRLKSVKEVAQTAACIGREFGHRLLSQISPLAEGELLDALDSLIAAELLFRRGMLPDATYSFKHALVRDAAYESLLKSSRKKVHMKIISALEDMASKNEDFEPALLAYHCTEAGLEDQAIEYWRQAGQGAIERSANVEAIAHLNYGINLLSTLPEEPSRFERELKLQTMLAGPLISTKGYGAPETANVFARALELSKLVDDPAFLFPVLYQQWVYNVIASKINESYRHARQFQEIAAQQTATMPKVIAHRVTAVSHFFMGEFADARRGFEKALSLYDEELHKEATYHFGQNPKSACLAFLSPTLHIMGYPAEANSVAQEALEHAKQARHANTLAYTMFFGAVRTAACRRDLEATAKANGALSVLADEQGLALWKAYAMIHNGWIASCRRQFGESIELGKAALDSMKATGTALDKTLALAQLAESYAACRQHSEALAVVNLALDVVDQTDERWYESELIRLKAEQLLALNGPNGHDEVEEQYKNALAVARRQEAKSWELRTATSLARLWHDQADSDKALDLLAPIYEWFTEGFETADLRAASDLLVELQ